MKSRELTFTTKFKRVLYRLKKQGKDPEKIFVFVQLLLDERKISPNCREQGWVGEWKQCRECHIEPDWLLIYKIAGETVRFERTGRHTDLFDE